MVWTNMVRKIKGESIWIVDHYEIGRHSRILHLRLPKDIVHKYDIRRGDKVKAMLIHVKSKLPGSRKVKLWFVYLFPVRTHARRLYLPLDPAITRLYDIEKGDEIKAMLVEVFKDPREDDEENDG